MVPKLICSYLFFITVVGFLSVKLYASDFSTDPLSHFEFDDKQLQDRVVSDVVTMPESMDVILAYDFTSSNAQMGIKSFGGKNLHHLFSKKDVRHNPYQTVTKILLSNLFPEQEEMKFQVLGFGDEDSLASLDKTSYLRKKSKPVQGLYGVLKAYRSYSKKSRMAGPTSFAGPIELAAEQAAENSKHTLLVLISDGALSTGEAQKETLNALVAASRTPLSVLIIGVGDGTERERTGIFPGLAPFRSLKTVESDADDLWSGMSKQLAFDNVDFVNANEFLGGLVAGEDPSIRLENMLMACVKKIASQRLYMQNADLI